MHQEARRTLHWVIVIFILMVAFFTLIAFGANLPIPDREEVQLHPQGRPPVECPEGTVWSDPDQACARAFVFQCHPEVVVIKVYARAADGLDIAELGEVRVPRCE